MSGYRGEYFSKSPCNHGWYTCVLCSKNFSVVILILTMLSHKAKETGTENSTCSVCANTAIDPSETTQKLCSLT